MKHWCVITGLVFAFSMVTMGQQATTTPGDQTNSPAVQKSAPPSGTRVHQRATDTLVQPVPKQVRVTRQMIVSAQKELVKRGYDAGPADGVAGPRTRAAVRRFQSDQQLAQTGQLDVTTMEKLNIGGLQTLGSAPADVGRGGKAFGHNIKEGHPVAASKGLGKGAVSSGKKVAKGSESLAKEGVEKVGSGLSKIGRKIEGKTEGEPKNPPPSDQNARPSGPPPQL